MDSRSARLITDRARRDDARRDAAGRTRTSASFTRGISRRLLVGINCAARGGTQDLSDVTLPREVTANFGECYI